MKNHTPKMRKRFTIMTKNILPIEEQYLNLCADVIKEGSQKELFNSDGQYIKTIFGAMLKHNFDLGFPVYSSKKVMWRTAIKEMLWFIQGNDDPKWLIENNVRIWDDWIYKAHKLIWPESSMSKERFFQVVRENPDSDALPTFVPLHYSNITCWDETGHNQTDWILEQLPNAPHRKSYLVSLWNPATVYHQAETCDRTSVVLPACHFAHQLVSNSPNSLSLVVDIRSNDLFLGNPFNVAQYGALLEMYCLCLTNRTKTVWTPNQLVVMVHDAHLYSKHFDAIQQQYEQSNQIEEFNKAELQIENRNQKSLLDFQPDDFQLTNYHPQKSIKADLFDAGGY